MSVSPGGSDRHEHAAATSVRCPRCGRIACGCTAPPDTFIPVGSAAFVHLAPRLSNPLTQRYVLMRYGLGESRLDAAAIAGAFQDQPLDADEARVIAEGWHRD